MTTFTIIGLFDIAIPEEMTSFALDHLEFVNYSFIKAEIQGTNSALQEDQKNFILRRGECTLWTRAPVFYSRTFSNETLHKLLPSY